MTRRTVLAAVLLTVLASSCNNKVWIDCPTTTVTRTKNRALITIGPNIEPIVPRNEAKTC